MKSCLLCILFLSFVGPSERFSGKVPVAASGPSVPSTRMWVVNRSRLGTQLTIEFRKAGVTERPTAFDFPSGKSVWLRVDGEMPTQLEVVFTVSFAVGGIRRELRNSIIYKDGYPQFADPDAGQATAWVITDRDILAALKGLSM